MNKTRSTRPYILVITVLAVICGIVACEREKRDYAARSQSQAGTEIHYASDSHNYAVEGPALVREVLPQGDETLSGEALFVKNCSACHQITGQGIPGAFPPLANSPYVNSDNSQRMASIMLYGLMGEIHVNGVAFNSVMAPLGGALNDQELSAIATYVRNAWGNKAAPIEADVFAAMRTKWGARSFFNIKELGEEK